MSWSSHLTSKGRSGGILRGESLGEDIRGWGMSQ